MKIKLIQLGVGIFLTLGSVPAKAQTISVPPGGIIPTNGVQIFNIANVPVKSGTAALHRKAMKNALPYILAEQPIPTNKVPIVAQVDSRGENDPYIGPESLIASTKLFDVWQGVEIPNTKDPLFKPYKGQDGNSVGAIFVVQGDGTYPLALNEMIVQAEIFMVPGNTNLVIPPSAIWFEGLTYPKDSDGWPLTNEDGELLKPKRVKYSSLKSLQRSRAKVDSFILHVQFGNELSVDASALSGLTPDEKIAQATEVVLDQRSDILIYVGFVDKDGFVNADFMTFFWVTPNEVENPVLQ